MELELKTKDQINIDYNKFFYATMCHVCKRFGDDVPLKPCGRCKLISYCGEEHRKQHWAQHRHLCKTVQEIVMKDKRYDKNPKRKNSKLLLMFEVLNKMDLELYEKQMFGFPKECAVCYERNAESLIVCQKCAHSFCKDHKDDNAHKDACVHLERCLRIYLSDADNESIANMYLQRSSEMTDTPLQYEDFINRYRNDIEGHSETPHDLLEAGLSGHLTYFLTFLYAMKELNYVPKGKELVIHIVAPDVIEKSTLKMWEILLHVAPKAKVSLMIVLIGEGLSNESPALSPCHSCLSRGKKLSFKFYNGLYEDYVRSQSFVKPNLALAFNVDIQKRKKDVAEITMASIKVLAEQNCPFVITNHTQKTLEESMNRINTILERKVDPVYIGQSTLANSKPYRCPIEGELVFFNNNFMAVYRSLC